MYTTLTSKKYRHKELMLSSKLLQAVMIMTCIREVGGSNPSRETGYYEEILFSSVLPGICHDKVSIRSPSKHFPIHHLPNILPFDAI
jgi:hypothetical protein